MPLAAEQRPAQPAADIRGPGAADFRGYWPRYVTRAGSTTMVAPAQ